MLYFYKLKLEFVLIIKFFFVFGETGNQFFFITKDDILYTFGDNLFWCLGLGHNNAVRVPEFVKELCGQQLNEISYGLRHMLSLTEDSLFSGASNIYGQLGSRQK